MIIGRNTKITIKDKEIIGIGKWTLNTIPWYLRWWFDWKMKRMYKKYGGIKSNGYTISEKEPE